MFLTLIILHNHEPALSARHINMLFWQVTAVPATE
jgi:hypothetical protein